MEMQLVAAGHRQNSLFVTDEAMQDITVRRIVFIPQLHLSVSELNQDTILGYQYKSQHHLEMCQWKLLNLDRRLDALQINESWQQNVLNSYQLDDPVTGR